MKFHCAQRGCVFDAEVAPENCLVCNNPFIISHAPKKKRKKADDQGASGGPDDQGASGGPDDDGDEPD
jgi:hypothetical protein